MSKNKSKQEEALQFLDDLDSLGPASTAAPSGPATTVTPANAPTVNEGEAEVLAFLDEITQKSTEPTPRATHLERPASRSGTPTIRKSTERVRVGGPASASLLAPSSSATGPRSASPAPSTPGDTQPPIAPASAAGPWGWGSVWNTASAALQQAKSVVDEQVKNLPKNEQARKWGEGVMEYAKTAQLEKIGKDFTQIGLSTLTDILNAVAPPISEHEVIQVWLSHDMRGYDGIEALAYRSLARIMEQVEGGDLIVNRGDESKPKDTKEGRDLNPVDGYDAAIKLSKANLDEITKKKDVSKLPVSSAQSPTTYSYVFLRVQPFTSKIPVPPRPTGAVSANAPDAVADTQEHVQFVLYLSDPGHELVHTTVTQAVPGKWLDLWDKYDWVEDLVAEALRIGVEVIGQEYIVARMGWGRASEKQADIEPQAERKSAEA